MLDPMMVATSVSRLRLRESAESKAGVASMTPASQGGRMNPTIGCSRMTGGNAALRTCRRQVGLKIPHALPPPKFHPRNVNDDPRRQLAGDRKTGRGE